MTLSDFDREYRSRYRWTSSALSNSAFVISDLLGIMLSFGAGFFVVNLYDFPAINFRSFVMYWPYLPAFIFIFQIMNLYPGVSLAPSEELRHFFTGSLMTHGGIIISRYIEDQEFDAISIAFIISFVLSTIILLAARNITHWILHKTGLGGIPAVIYGSGGTGRLVADRLLDGIRTGYLPVLILDDEPDGIDEYRGIPIIHDTGAGPDIVKRYNIKMAIVAVQKLDEQQLKKLMNYSVSAFRYSVLIPDFFNVTNTRMTIRDFDGVLGFVTNHKLRMFWNLALKRFIDLFIVILGGLVILPFLLLVALLVKISSTGPVLYRHKRIGKDGNYFSIYKFRTMVVDAEERLQKLLESDPEIKKEWAASHKLRNDPRITKIGSLLRRTSIDEFPQLINILKNEMSLVGPRPITGAEIEKYGEDFKRIFSVKPGLTGLWQVSGRSDADYAERVSFDTYYLQSWSVWLDIWVILKTFTVVFKGKGAY